MALERKIEDVLGDIYMRTGMGQKSAGQFFTPYHLCELTAEMITMKPDKNGKYTINEPACGGGGLILAMLSVLKRRGVDYQRDVKVVAQDLDWKGVYMSYLQLSMIGARAICIQGDALSAEKPTEKRNVLYTPMERGILI